jgi:hypothetical protein
VLTDPLAVTYDGTPYSLPRVEVRGGNTRYATADKAYEVTIRTSAYGPAADGIARVDIMLTRLLPDPTPSNVFDAFRFIRNGFGLSYVFDSTTRAETSVDIPKLRTATLALVDSTLQSRLISGER